MGTKAVVRGLLTFQDLGKEVCVILVVEGRISAQQNVRDDSNAPDVNFFPVRLLREHFWGDVA